MKIIAALALSIATLFHFSTSALESQDTVLLAILARNKAHTLPRYLKCIDNLEYNKQLITVYINTNNNVDDTQKILDAWVKENQYKYRDIIYDKHEIQESRETRPHEWTPERFKTLGTIRNKSMKKARDNFCDYYFVVDCDNFIKPYTLKELIKKKKPIIAPMLTAIPEREDPYSNFFCDVTETGYYKDHPNYRLILDRNLMGTIKVPVVHCTYLIQTSYIDKLTYTDKTNDYEFVIFSRSARENNVDQYICNDREYGELLHFYSDLSLEDEKRKAASAL